MIREEILMSVLLERVESRRQLLVEMRFVPENTSRHLLKPSKQCALLIPLSISFAVLMAAYSSRCSSDGSRSPLYRPSPKESVWVLSRHGPKHRLPEHARLQSQRHLIVHRAFLRLCLFEFLGDLMSVCPTRSVQGHQSRFNRKQAEDWRTCSPFSMTGLAFAHRTSI
jgi:hypothetical protein